MDAGRARADVVLEAQPALEVIRCDRATERAQQRLGLAVGDRGRRGVREVLGLVGLQSRRARHRGPAGRQRVARVLPQVLDRAALDGVGGAEGAVGVDRALDEAVVLRIGVDDHADGAVLLGEVRLDAAEVLAVADEHDLAVHVDAELVERGEVLGAAVVGVDDRRGHVARGRVGVVADHDVLGVLLPREAVVLDRGQRALRRRGHRHLDAARLGEVDAVVRAADLQAVRAQHGHRLLEAAAVAGACRRGG